MKFGEWLLRFLNYPIENAELKCRILELENQIETYKHQIKYDFIPASWKEVVGNVVTSKTQQDGIPLEWDIRDLLNSTVYSRRLAEEIIEQTPRDFDTTSDHHFEMLCLNTANKVIELIKYKSNQIQFGKMDVWNNGDTAIVTKQGDCDLSVRVFVRVMNDILDKLKMFEYKKLVFQAVGFYHGSDGSFGHSWAVIFLPNQKSFRVIECTLDEPYETLKPITKIYEMWFCLNFRNVWKQNNNWQRFL